ncbi:nitroreductase family protein [Paramaledivibacter caminithermalis]|jgi:nitroreductase|uniref:Putative TM nitroreductase n=1 Tax=Paramaledivibacter caminithermalis (strain DSM 15212 / CIP 107654 / DViRD3) TaxID=1121301 RepID=A0A1M6T8D0_PARC5|nr:nitroreductase family protein [Paramaledivibacter caminithermalis]SHK53200.1 Putative TM nitroreductase [Paramaledivibacter caminithermalis DSM 15212]
MENKNFYDVIFKRKSVRKYNLENLDDTILEEVSTFISSVKPMYEEIKTEIKIVKLENVKNLLPIRAPYYILFSSENKEGYLTNAGFMLQQIDLFLSANELGSCWVGMAQPKKEILKKLKLEFIIALAFGKPAEFVHRKNLKEFRRKSIEEIRDTNEKDELIEPARLAPSATNSQPWFFRILNNKIHAYCIKQNLIKAILLKKMNQIDMGIAICHIWIAAKKYGKDMKIITDRKGLEYSPKGYNYVISLIID